MRKTTFGIPFACFALAIFASGCGGAGGDLPELVPVTGQVTKGGQPVEGASVTFTPEKGGLSGGMTDAEGRFELYYTVDHKGAVIGKHVVKVSKMEGEAGDETIPAEFNENSTLTKEVTKEGPNDFKIEI
jgi:hypothetical protein